MDGFGGITQQEVGKGVLTSGVSDVLLIMVGIAKLLGAVDILQNKFKTVKEWAYAGFAINFIGAFASRVFIGDGISLLIPPVIALS
ncbi:DoxX-like family protein [Pedobacter terrae]|uniref:DoxX-like family protein n=1 Tax=Pedobacter terrae TaxID=405671 RepID=A0A1G7TGU7_9SPHI|nr:DoxX family protein [Pedobacter terrae]SDG34244.1 DoxX-like family protein [Pedobacter terrae]